MRIVLRDFTELDNSNVSKFTIINTIEIIWTSLPAFIF